MYFRFRTDGNLFNLRRLLANTKIFEEPFTVLYFGDDYSLLAHIEEAPQHIINYFSDAPAAFGFTQQSERKKNRSVVLLPSRRSHSPQINIDP